MIGIFWTRIGTPTAKYASGAVEEIEEHVAAGKPTMLYFSTAPVSMDAIDAKQFEGLKTFRTSCQSRGLYETYASVDEFRRDLSRQLQIRMNQAPFDGLGDGKTSSTTTASNAPAELSPEAQKLLAAAAADGSGVILRMPYGGGTSISVGDTTFTDDSNPRSVATWESAIEELEAHGYAKTGSDAREVFSLTRKGFEREKGSGKREA